MSFSEVSKATTIPRESLKQKARRDNWLITSTLTAKAKSMAAIMPAREEDSGVDTQLIPTEVLAAESITEKGQRGALSVVDGILPLIQRTMKAGSSLLAKDIEGWKDFGTAFGIFAKASGLDRPQTAVQINFFDDQVKPM